MVQEGLIGWEQRPQRFGVGNRLQKIGNDYERSFRAINDSKGNPTYVGYAVVGANENHNVWQIFKIEWDGNGGVVSITWPVNNNGEPSSAYQFSWSNASSYTYV